MLKGILLKGISVFLMVSIFLFNCISILPMEVEATSVYKGALYSEALITDITEKVDSNVEPVRSAYNQLIIDCEAVKNETPSAIASLYVPPYYNDPDAHRVAKASIEGDARAAYKLALGYKLNSNTVYADKAVALLNAWANINTSISTVHDTPLVASASGIGLIYAADMLNNYSGWSYDDRIAFQTWVKNVYLPPINSIRSRNNNWSSWGVYASFMSYNLLGDTTNMQDNVTRLKNNIESQIADDGHMPHETDRGDKGIWYTYYGLAPMTMQCQAILNTLGENIYEYVSPSGKTLKSALDFLFIYSKDPASWPWGTQVNLPSAGSWPGNLFEAMSSVYKDSNYFNWVTSARPISYTSVGEAWKYSTLITPTIGLEPVAFNASADAFIRDGSSSNNNYGTSTGIEIKNSSVEGQGYIRKGYMTFDFSSLSGVAIGSAKLKLKVSEVGTDDTRKISVYGVNDETWGETDITWSEAPTAGTLIGSIDIGNINNIYYEFDVTSYVQQHFSDKKVSFRLVNETTSTAGNNVTFASKEATGDKTYMEIVPVKNIKPSEDSFIRDGSYANYNYGDSSGLEVKRADSGYNRIAYLTFDFADLTIQNIRKASLILRTTSVGQDVSRTINVYMITDESWDEDNITWSNSNDMQTEGMFIGSITVDTTVGRWYSIDVSKYLENHLMDKRVAFKLVNEGPITSGNNVTFGSDESTDSRPILQFN